MTRSIIAECGHREDTRKIEGGECRDCRGVGRSRPEHVATTDDPHEAARSRSRVINNAVNQ